MDVSLSLGTMVKEFTSSLARAIIVRTPKRRYRKYLNQNEASVAQKRHSMVIFLPVGTMARDFTFKKVLEILFNTSGSNVEKSQSNWAFSGPVVLVHVPDCGKEVMEFKTM